MIVDPRKARARWSLPLLKVLPGQRFRVELGGDRWWWFGSHWLEKLFLCVGDGCEGCVYGAPRVMGYRVGWLLTPESRRAVLLESPLTSVTRYESLATMEGLSSERGAVMELTRRHRRCGVAMEPTSDPGTEGGSALSDCHTIQAVALIFGLPQMLEGELPAAWAERVKQVAHARLVAAIALSK